MYLKDVLANRVVKAIQTVFGVMPEGVQLDFPPEPAMGDFSYACFPLAPHVHQSPSRIAVALSTHLTTEGLPDDLIDSAVAKGSYLNLHLNTAALFGYCRDVMEGGSLYGSWDVGRGKRVMVEYLSPNTNKPLHLGHVRNGCLGVAVANLFGGCGYDVVKANLINDRGIHICKSMLAWQKWGDGMTPADAQIKGDHFVGRFYVCYEQESQKDTSLADQISQMLRFWEQGDEEIRRLWETMNRWVYEGFDETYKSLGFQFDHFYFESETYMLGRDLVDLGLASGVFTTNTDGSVVAFMPITKEVDDGKCSAKTVVAFGAEKDGGARKVCVRRADGTSLYITQDLGTAKMKFDEFGLDRSVYVVGSEQDYHFKCLFEMLRMLGFEWASGCYHLSYGMVYLPEGKMKSREGKVVDADDLVASMRSLAKEEIQRRSPHKDLSDEEVDRRSAVIANAAIKFYLLNTSPRQDMHFNPEESISFDGRTGPYCLYAYARACALMRKATKELLFVEPGYSALGNDEEHALMMKIAEFPEQVKLACEELNPTRITTVVCDTAKAFNQFYQKHPVFDAGSEELVAARLCLTQAAIVVLRNGLGLLGIDVLEEM